MTNKNEIAIKLPRSAMYFRESQQESNLVQFAESQDNRKRFKMTIYTGADMQSFWWGKVALDLAGGKLEKNLLPALREHNIDQIAGWHDQVEFGKKVVSSGYLTEATESGRETAALLQDKFPFQASAGVWPTKLENVGENATAEVNGRQFTGPGVIFRKWVLREASFCVFGADNHTSALAAAAGEEEEIHCEFIGEVPAPLTTGQDRENERKNTMGIFGKDKVGEPGTTPAPEAPKVATFSQEDLDLAQRASFASGREEGLKAGRTEGTEQGAAAERQRILEIQKFALPGQEAIVQKAIAEGKTVEEAKGLYLEAARQEKSAGLERLKGQATPSAGTVNGGAEQFTDATKAAGQGQPGEAELRTEFAADPDREGFLRLSRGDEEAAFKQFCALRRAEKGGRIRGR